MGRWRLIRRGVRRFLVLAMPVLGGWLVVGNMSWWPAAQSWTLRVPVGIALIALAIVLQVLVGWFDDKSASTGAFRVAMKDGLLPLEKLISEMPNQNAANRRGHLKAVASAAAMSLAYVWMGHVKKPRATVYLMSVAGDALEVLGYGGRGEKPGTFTYDKGTASQAAIARVKNNKTLIVSSMRRDPPTGFDGRKTDYDSFISVPIVDNAGYAYGMINIDSPRSRSFKESDKHVINVVAELMAIACGIAYPNPSQRRSSGVANVGADT